MLAMSLANQSEIPWWIFKNSVKLNLKKLDKPVSHKTPLFSALNKVCIIEFNSAFNSQDIYNGTININGTNFNLEYANKLPDLRRYCTFRFHFLPSNFKCELLKNFFDAFRIDGLRIEDISEENYKYRPLKNGVKRVKISYPKQTENIIKNLSGPANIFGLRCVVSIVGQKPKCYFCDDENHNVAKFPVKESLCGKCHQKEEIQTNTDENVDEMPKTPEYQPNVSNDQDSIALLLSSAQILKTPVLEDHLNTLQIPTFETEQEENDPKKQYLDSADEDDDTFESEMTISTEHHAEQSTNSESKCSMKTYAVTQQPVLKILKKIQNEYF
ncbi:hypothetical protein BpHYR1_042167 [Brachionus plicatilis]|uniref:Uncharacterized protein n=1 Tax=Brachionus plicatilis TaxID=10195 RepID=A0A3M7SF53_BRAPC|nr:hypothetical protein BpHYR1_042167 [Brachionus plicatilis]